MPPVKPMLAKSVKEMPTDATVPGALGTSPLGISPSGVIAGSYMDAGGNDHGFVMNVQ